MKNVFIVVGALLLVGAVWYLTRKPQTSATLLVVKDSKPVFLNTGVVGPKTTSQSGIVNKPSVASQIQNQHPVMNTNIGTPVVTPPIIPSSNGMIAQSSYSNSDVYTAPGGSTITTTAGTQRSKVTGPDYQGDCFCNGVWAKECCSAKSVVTAGLQTRAF